MTYRILAAGLALALSTPAVATDVAVVGVHDATLSTKAQRDLSDALAEAIDKLDGFDALDLDEVAARISGREEIVVAEVFERSGRRLLEDGNNLHQQAQPEEAVSLLEAAVSELQAAVRYTRDVRQLWEAWMLLATVHVAEGNEEAAREAVSQAIALQPTRLPDPAVVPPPVIALFDHAQTQLLVDLPRLVIRSPVELESLWVDGASVDPSLTSLPVPAGRHHVHGRTEDRRLAYGRAEVSAAVGTTVALDPESPRLGLDVGSDLGRSQDVGALYAALGQALRTDLVLLVGRVGGGMQLQLHAPSVGAFSEPVMLPPDAERKDLVDGVVQLLADLPDDGALPTSAVTFTALPTVMPANLELATLLLAPAEASLPMPTVGPVATPPPKKKWPVYVGIGGGVVGAAVITAVAVALTGGRGNGGTIIFGAQP